MNWLHYTVYVGIINNVLFIEINFISKNQIDFSFCFQIVSVKSLEIVNYIVSDNECPADLLEKVARQDKLSVPVVSLTWVQQCIIHNGKRTHTMHPAYLYSYVLEPESPEYWVSITQSCALTHTYTKLS